jgi:hypothetical protein
MELLELLLASSEMCGCLLELFAALLDGYAAFSGYRVGRQQRAYRRARAEGRPDVHRPAVWPFLLVLLFAVGVTALVIYRWVLR